MNMSAKVSEVIRKWYKALSFPAEYDAEFYALLENGTVEQSTIAAGYDRKETDGKKNLLYYLYFCEELRNRYKEKGIPDEILYNTLADIPLWTKKSTEKAGTLCLLKNWLYLHFSMSFFKIGRLQFHMTAACADIPEKSIQKGDNMIGIHISEEGPLYPSECVYSIQNAKLFFAKHFPEFNYEHMFCFSWLLDESLKGMLKPDSNILQFQNLFDIVFKRESDSILEYIIGSDITRDDIKKMRFDARFKREILNHVLAEKPFYMGYGILKDTF